MNSLDLSFNPSTLLIIRVLLDNVSMPLYYKGVKRKERTERAMHYLRKSRSRTDWSHHLPSELSGGQKQRVAIARASSE